ncbi:MAG: glycosyltransferase family 2 protein [Chitinophagaceae bacterium]|nr:glycosyltransferase family 2 protein [Chitinophagaceae bacterium]
MELTILMPCLNEAETIGTCIKKAHDWILKNAVEAEILISDNGSTDGSQKIAADLGARVINTPGKGYGAALISGILNAKGKYVIMGDSDDSYDFSSLTPFLDKLRQGFDLVMGNRFKGGIAKGAMPPVHRYFGTPLLSFIGRLFFKSTIGDIQCALRGFKQDIVTRLHLQTLGMEFASEMIVKASLFHFKIAEVPTTLSVDGRSRKPHLKTWPDGWRNLRFYLMHSPKWLFYIPGCFLFFTGLVLMLLTILNPFEIIRGIHLDANTLLFGGVFIITGFSCLTLGMFTRTYATEEGFLPKNKFDDKIEKLFTLESGILIGLLVFLSGLAGSIYAFYIWQQAKFGNLEYREILRIVVPSATLILLGTQLLFSSFFLGILKIKRRAHVIV